MIKLTSKKNWNLGPAVWPAGSYFLRDVQAAGALELNDGLEVETVRVFRPWDPMADWNGKRVLVCRSGGFGDMLFTTPLLREMKHRWPGMALDVSIHEHYHDALWGHAAIDELLPYPLTVDRFGEYAGVLWIEHLLEHDPRAREMHAVDLVAAAAGLELTRGRHLDFTVNPEAARMAAERWPRGPLPRVGVHLRASARCRSWPAGHSSELVMALRREAEVFLFDSPLPGSRMELENVVSLPSADPPLSFMESAAVLASCDLVIGPDSALIHVAGALGIPAIGLFGPFPWQLRTEGVPTTLAFSGPFPCAPCFHRPVMTDFPPDGICARTGRCAAMEAIDPGRVFRAARKLLEDMRPKVVCEGGGR